MRITPGFLSTVRDRAKTRGAYQKLIDGFVIFYGVDDFKKHVDSPLYDRSVARAYVDAAYEALGLRIPEDQAS